jgi:hypothetical protein
MQLVLHWFYAFTWTLLLEQIAAGLLLRRALPASGRRVSIITVANLASHPAVWLIFPELCSGRGLNSRQCLVLSEIWAFGLEGWIYWLFLGPGQLRLALTTTVVANAVSLTLGFALRHFGWL